jgi:hypothetical protein
VSRAGHPDASRVALAGTVETRPLAADLASTGPTDLDGDVGRLVSESGNRWSRPGQPTLYLARDPGVAIAEWGRHWDDDAGPIAVWEIRVDLAAAVDLREPATRRELGLPVDPAWCLERERCRAVSDHLRSGGDVEALIVPTVAFLDDPARWNAVIFVDRLPGGLDPAVRVGAMHARLDPATD